MQILDNVIILILIVLAFIAGKLISDRYNERIIEYLQYVIRCYAGEKGVGFVAFPVKKKSFPIGQPFMDKLKENGHATQTLR